MGTDIVAQALKQAVVMPAWQLTRVDEIVHQHHLQHCPAAQLRQPARSVTSSELYLELDFRDQGEDNYSL